MAISLPRPIDISAFPTYLASRLDCGGMIFSTRYLLATNRGQAAVLADAKLQYRDGDLLGSEGG